MSSVVSTNANLVFGDWNHVSFTYNKSSSTVKIFVNGNEVGSAVDVNINLQDNSQDFLLASNFEGAIDDVIIYNKELTRNEMSFLADSTKYHDNTLTSKLSGHWSVHDFTTVVDSIFDSSQHNNHAASAGTVVHTQTQSSKGNVGLAFNGLLSVSASNDSFKADFMSVGAWVNPSNYDGSILSKDGVFNLKLNTFGEPELIINSEDNVHYTNLYTFSPDDDSAKLVSPQVAFEPVAHFEFNNDVSDTTGLNANGTASNIRFVSSSDFFGKTCAELTDTDSYINIGKVLQQVTNSNQFTLSTWVNLQELQNNSNYPIMSLNNSFELFVSKDSTNSFLNFYVPQAPTLLNFDRFSASEGEFTVSTSTNLQYTHVVLTENLDLNIAENVNLVKNIAYPSIQNTITPSDSSVTFTTSPYVYTKDGTQYAMNTVNQATAYLLVSTGGVVNDTFIYKNNDFNAANENPYIKASTTVSATSIQVTGSVFSAYADITKIDIYVFPEDTLLATPTSSELDSLTPNASVSLTSPNQYYINAFDESVTSYTSDSTSLSIDDTLSYKVILRVNDSNGNNIVHNMDLSIWWRMAVTTDGQPVATPTFNGISYYHRGSEQKAFDKITDLSGSTTSISYPTYVHTPTIYISAHEFGGSYNSIGSKYTQEDVSKLVGVNFDENNVYHYVDGKISRQIQMFGWDIVDHTTPNAPVLWDYEFPVPSQLKQIVFTDGNGSSSTPPSIYRQGSPLKFTIYRSDDGTNWEYHSEYLNVETAVSVTKLKVIQWENDQWVFKGSYTLSQENVNDVE